MAVAALTAARRRAVELVFEALQRGVPLLALFAQRGGPPLDSDVEAAQVVGSVDDAVRPHPYTARLVQGVASRQDLNSEWLD
ncbi:MAG: hypothetical protein LBD90_06595, partial [Bifidobacteriaceae bacterium]|nr:hypothetical protein [Bifidobacteriaceae bacterium]